jgi:hypothetical protein
MRLLQKVSFLLLATGLALGQTNAPATGPDDSNSVANELKALREAIAAQQQQIAQQQQQIAQQQQQLDKLQKQSAATDSSSSGRLVDANLKVAAPATVSAYAQDKGEKESPLSFRIGAAEFTPGGFVDFENVFRSTNTGNVTATSFGAIPFNNTVQGHLTEYRSTGQYSRFNIKTHAKFGENDITGYLEFDFNGNDAANVFVTSNGHTDRLRLYWLDLKRGKWEFLAGQTWGLQTPNRVGVSPMPSDLSLGYHEDAGIGVGYNYTRAAAFRVAYHFNKNWVWAAEIQNPQQFVGAGEVVFPFALNAALGVQFDAANNPGAPNAAPDFLTKIAYDNNPGGRHIHLEAGGLFTTAKAYNPITNQTHTAAGGGFMFGVAADLYNGSDGRNIRFVSSGMWGDGIGRYLNGLAPNTVVEVDGRPSLVHSGDFVGGFEFQPHRNAQFGAYYGGAYAQRNFFLDTTNPLPGRFAGFGAPNSPNSANRSLQQGTLDWTQTFWKNPQYGAVLLVTQFSYVTRSPWFVAAGAPKNAHLGMSYVSLRYVLP